MSKNKKIFISIVCGLIILIPCFVLAADPATGKLTNPLGTTDLQTLIGKVIKAVLGIVGSIALLMFIYGGFMWMTSSGNEQKISKGKNVLTWATIGLAIIFLSYTLVNFVIGGLTGGSGGTSPTTENNTPVYGTCSCSGNGKLSSPHSTYEECNVYENGLYAPCTWAQD